MIFGVSGEICDTRRWHFKGYLHVLGDFLQRFLLIFQGYFGHFVMLRDLFGVFWLSMLVRWFLWFVVFVVRGCKGYLDDICWFCGAFGVFFVVLSGFKW